MEDQCHDSRHVHLADTQEDDGARQPRISSFHCWSERENQSRRHHYQEAHDGAGSCAKSQHKEGRQKSGSESADHIAGVVEGREGQIMQTETPRDILIDDVVLAHSDCLRHSERDKETAERYMIHPQKLDTAHWAGPQAATPGFSTFRAQRLFDQTQRKQAAQEAASGDETNGLIRPSKFLERRTQDAEDGFGERAGPSQNAKGSGLDMLITAPRKISDKSDHHRLPSTKHKDVVEEEVHRDAGSAPEGQDSAGQRKWHEVECERPSASIAVTEHSPKRGQEKAHDEPH